MDNCKTCPTNDICSKDKDSCIIENNPLNNVKKIIGVMSGKGGVGKSSISVLIANTLNQQGYRVGVLDADITGPSVPKLFGSIGEKVSIKNQMMIPIETGDGIKIMSLNYLIDKEDDPVIWRGPLLSSVVKQFWTQVLWEDLDYLVIDIPPGTGDVALTVMQSIPINGLVIVSVPQEFASMIVAKAVNMVRKMKMKILGVIENMSYITCPDCCTKIKLFSGRQNLKFLQNMDLKLLGELPMLDSISQLAEDENKNIDKNLYSIFNPIVQKIIKDL